MQADANAAGKMVKCPGCGAKIKIPEDPKAKEKADAVAGLTQRNSVSAPSPSGMEDLAASASQPPKPNIPLPGAAASSPPPPTSAPAESAAADAPAEENEEQHETAAGPRPIEYFYGGKVGNLASINFWMSLGIGLGLTVAWFGIMFVIHSSFPAKTEGGEAGTYISRLFLERSWVQYATTFLATWTIGILILKSLHIQRQRRSLLIDILPQEVSPEINIHNIADFYDHVIGMPRRTHGSFMFHRIRKGLEYFYIRESNTEVAAMMSSQSDIDANAINGSYSLSKVFLWAIPIMGFIGTVLGIGAAIGEFAETLDASSAPPAAVAEAEPAADADAAADGAEGETAPAAAPASEQDAMMAGLKKVLAGLGTAFDTTFLALIFSILLMIPASSLQAAEEDVLNQVDEYCNDNLIKRLNDGGAGQQFTDTAALKALGEAISASNKDVVGKFGEIHSNMAEVYDKQTSHYGKVAEAVDKQLSSIDTRAKEYETRLDEDFFKNLDKIRTESVDTINAGIKPLTEGIVELNKLLKALDGKQVQVKKKGWFSRG